MFKNTEVRWITPHHGAKTLNCKFNDTFDGIMKFKVHNANNLVTAGNKQNKKDT